MQTLIEVDGRILVTDILTEHFLCDIARCKGMCCVEGNAGAPLEEEELGILEDEYENFRTYMTPEGRAAVASQGLYVRDADGDWTTPLVGEADCAYAFHEGGVTMCAIERAWREGQTPFMKPVSCHLYPIRVRRFSDGSEGLNYHRWDVCAAACANGRAHGVRIYEALKAPLIRRFGEEFYNDLCEAARYMEKQQ